jgi:ribonuclease HII
MPFDPANLSITELRRRFVTAGEPATAHVLRKLQRDPRRGVRQVYEVLKKKHERHKESRLHLDALLHFERLLWSSGIRHLAGVDEAGVGPLAGPVVAAAVVFPPGTEIADIDDSKRLDPETRQQLAVRIRATATGVGIGVASVAEIDSLNVYRAALLAMRRSVQDLPVRPQHVLVDARTIPDLDVPQNQFSKGDGINFSIAAASIIAKTHRDALMEELHRTFPTYGFAGHKGYATAEHQEAIRRHGPCACHRRSYAFIGELCGELSAEFYALQAELGETDGRRELRRFEARLDDFRERLTEYEHRKLRLALTRRWKGL